MEAGSEAPRLIVWLAIVFFGSLTCASSEFHLVGGKDGWKSGVNYTVWAANQSFHVGDWLLFRFDKFAFDILEVNKTSYDKCNGQDFITNITRGGRDVFQLNESRPYFFICSKGYCFNGMKLAINVEELPSPAPSPSTNGVFPSNSLNRLCIRSLLLIITLPWFFLMKMY
ncbi:hypothetical protein Nepgr_021189 [Nepenthes gracilis]|uniref:Phytocyanin domain-containing protein n=1 Tax=Nepenthes gracilis TaxID=150966 RepID=A0AAD3XVW9_NEPGR|nr:hypothetical protein Nepgr_021189 [Nepenthes gracilis]